MKSKAIATTVLTLALLGVSLASSPAFAQLAPAVTIAPEFSLYLSGGWGGGPITYGWKFQPTADLTVVQLGVCDGAPYSAVGLSETHDIGIFDAAGSLIVSANVPAGTGGLLVDNFWYVSIPPTILSAGKVYTIGALYPWPMNDMFLDSTAIPPGGVPPITLDPRITWLAGVNDYPPGGPGLTFPTAPCCEGLFGFFGPSFRMASLLTVAIDIKPGDFPNSINLRSNGVVPVAVFGSSSFDASKIDPASLKLAGATVKLIGKGKYSCHAEDVNLDGRPDLLCQFPTSQLVIRPGDHTVALEGKTFAGADFQGMDTVRIVPN